MLDDMLTANEDAELWWDALPSALAGWRERTVPRASVGFRDPDGTGLFTGATSNWRLIGDAIAADPAHWRAMAARVAATTPSTPEARFEAVCHEAFRRDAAMLRPLWEHSDARHGWVCAQVPPALTHDAPAMLASALTLAAIAPNVMVKVPVSVAGLAVIEALTARGVATNATLSFTVSQAIAGRDAVRRGLARRTPDARPLEAWRAVHTFMAGRLGREPAFAEEARAAGVALDRATVRWAEMAVFKRIHHTYAASGAPLKALLCSLMVDDGACFHLEQAVGAGSVITMPPSFLEALKGVSADLRPGAIDEPVPPDVLAALEQLPYFRAAYHEGGLAPEAFGRHPAFVVGLEEQRRAFDSGVAWAAGVALAPDPPSQETPA